MIQEIKLDAGQMNVRFSYNAKCLSEGKQQGRGGNGRRNYGSSLFFSISELLFENGNSRGIRTNQ